MTALGEIFSANGLLARALDGYTARTGQVRMAERIATAIAERRHLLVEAGTGTGKTFAYLVPALLSGRRGAIPTRPPDPPEPLYTRALPLARDAPGRAADLGLLHRPAQSLWPAR